jgi:DHA2 family lincomycin resistance protein-like MFS transporter
MLGGGLLSGVIGRLSGWLCDRYGARWLIILGTAILAAATFALSLATARTPVWLLAVEYSLVMGVGMGLIATPALTHGVNPLTPQLYPHGIAFVSTFQQVAGAAGNASLITVLVVFAGSTEGARQGDATGIRASLWVAGGIACAAFVLSMFIKQDRPHRSEELPVAGDAALQAQLTQKER